jgi:hypothetical protein
MAFFHCSINFQAQRTLDELEDEISRRYLGGLRFIPADRRDAREFTLAEFAEYPIFNHDVDLIWDEESPGHFRMSVLIGGTENWFPDPQSWVGWKSGSLQRCLGVLLRQIEGVSDIRINPNTAGPYLDSWQTRVKLNAPRRTVQEAAALLAQKLFCGIRFVPSNAPTMRDATEFETEHELLGHRITFRDTREGYYELAIQPSPWLLERLTPDETARLRGLDIRPWVDAPFQNHPWIRPGYYDDDESATKPRVG